MKALMTLLAVALPALIAGCAPVISQETLKTVDRTLSFKEIAADPSRYAGRHVVFGGSILNVENMEGVTLVEVVQEGMNSQLKPVDREGSDGRFMVRFKRFIDPSIYSSGKRLTVAGVITGTETRPIGKVAYRYPVIEPTEHYLWEPRDYERSSIGIGLGFGYSH